MAYGFEDYPFASRRYVTYAAKGMVATSHHLAAGAGLDMLKKGGNAVDAAVAAAAALTVLEPQSNGLGSDNFAIVWHGGRMYGLNGSGPAPEGISAEGVRRAGFSEMPPYGLMPVNTPAAPGGWAELSGRFGRLPFRELFYPAIEYAENGYAVSTTQHHAFKKNFDRISGQNDPLFKEFFNVYAPDGHVPLAGDILRLKHHAKTLEIIADTRAKGFYEGETADQIDAFCRQNDGFLRKSDLEGCRPFWVEPVSVNYRGYDVWELPPNGQGIVALMALNILKGFELSGREDPKSWHLQIEAMKLAFADGLRYITDPKDMSVSVSALLSDAYADERRRLIGTRAIMPYPGSPPRGGTVYLAAADMDGNMVSMIQSDYHQFGSGVVVPGTGVTLNNRGHCFSLEEGHDNLIRGGKRSYHTIIPGFLTKDEKPVGPFGVMGAFMQPQGHVQMVINTVDYGLNPQASLDAPRWQWTKGKSIELEGAVPEYIAQDLARCGHEVSINMNASSFGRGQMIWRTDGGVYVGGTEPRTEGACAAW